MKLIFLYGPPGVGKLTIARELHRLTGYKLFHNHLVADLVSSVFETGTKEYSSAAWAVRMLLIDAMVRVKVQGLIFTFTYGIETWRGRHDDRFVKELKRRIEKSGGTLHFVKLSCPAGELKKRVRRRTGEYGKLRNAKLLEVLLKKHRLTDAIPSVKSLEVDTAHLPPRQAAKLICEHFKVPWRQNRS